MGLVDTERNVRKMMSEEQIERSVERKFDSLDRRFMSGKLTQEEYDTEAERIRRWADKESEASE
jgi:hypothetical protein